MFLQTFPLFILRGGQPALKAAIAVCLVALPFAWCAANTGSRTMVGDRCRHTQCRGMMNLWIFFKLT